MDETLQEILNRIREAVNPSKIYLLGSRARGDFNPDSDFDIAVIYDGEKSKQEIRIEARRSCSGIAAAIDILTLTSLEFDRFKDIGTSLAKEISVNGRLVYGK
ncbi:nucleotidyltransferase domain-containing protein [bacterium]|nr:nucleotidyltransferase domain-containing protein [bacterium]